MLAISLNDYHLPDEYVDYAISFDAETSENQELPDIKDILTSILPFNWLPSNKEDATEDPHGMDELNECHLRDEDAPVLCYYDDDSDTTESEGPQSAKDLLGYIVPICWIRCNEYFTKQLPDERSVTSDMALNECHLPDDNDSTTKKHRPVMNKIFLNHYHLPDDRVDVVLSSFATNPSERRSAKNFKFHCKETTSAEPSPSLHRSMERLVKVISTDSKANESSSNSKLAWVFADEASKAKKDDSHAPQMIQITGVDVGKNPVEALVPLAKVSRGALRRDVHAISVGI